MGDESKNGDHQMLIVISNVKTESCSHCQEVSLLRLLVLLLSVIVIFSEIASADNHATPNTQNYAQRLGPPTMFFADVERYRFSSMDVNNPDFYPIPKTEVSRDTYMDWLEKCGMLDYVNQPRLGISGPTRMLPVLAKYVQTKSPKWGLVCIEMLKDFHHAIEKEVAQKGWTEQFAEPPAYIPLYRKYLIAGGLMTPDEPWFEELWLYYTRNLHVWGTKPIEWRGPCHRSMNEALAKGLAAKWYPDIPEAEHWRYYCEQVVKDFWDFKDLLQNDTGYFQDIVRSFSFSGDQLFGDERFLTDPDMQKIWQRLAAEITPDGAINPYGPNGGWNSTACLRIGVLERVASATGHGKYRYGAHKAMNYLLYQTEPTLKDYYLREMETAPYIVLAYLFADDTIEPQVPNTGSLVTHRHEVARIPHRDKNIVGKYLKDLDPDPDKANLCCNQTFTNRIMPDKLVLRSGWNPGDFYVLVELMPTSFPFNAGGIMGMNRWGAPFTQIVTSKGGTPENRMSIIDASGKVQRRYIPDPHRINENWEMGKMPDITTEIPLFHDADCATVARIKVRNVEGLPVHHVREFIFVKNRFLVTRETAIFEEAFPAKVVCLWNTQNIGPQIGSHWANTFISTPVASNGKISMKTPPVDLLVYFAPRPGWNMQVVDRTENDPRTEVCPAQVRYVWEGTTRAGEHLHSTQLYYPHTPSRARANTNNPGAKAVYAGGEIAATAGASAIKVVIDTLETTLMLTEFEVGHFEWMLFNPQCRQINNEDFCTDARYAYVSVKNNSIYSYICVDVSSLFLKGQTILRNEERTTIEYSGRHLLQL